MSDSLVTLTPLQAQDRERFIRDLQAAFEVAFVEEYGPQDKDVIPRRDIEHSLDRAGAEAFRIAAGGRMVGGVVVVIDAKTQHNSLDLLFIDPGFHSRGIGRSVWRAIEETYPETRIWETVTPYFEKRNIHFYVNKCGFQIVEFFNSRHREQQDNGREMTEQDCYFRFEKDMSCHQA